MAATTGSVSRPQLEFDELCKICRDKQYKWNSVPSEDDGAEIVRLEEKLIRANYGFRMCQPDPERVGTCMASRFSVDPIDAANVKLIRVLVYHRTYSDKNGKCSIVFEGRFNCEKVAVHAYNFCNTDPEDDCPCQWDSKDKVGFYNDRPFTVKVHGYVWNPAARVLWIVEQYCERVINDGLESFKLERFMKVKELKERDIKQSGVPATAGAAAGAGNSDEETMTDDGRRLHPDGSAPKQLEPFQYLRLDKPYLYGGELCFRQRLFAREAPLFDTMLSAMFDPEIKKFWWPDDKFVSFMNKERFEETVRLRISEGVTIPDKSLEQLISKLLCVSSNIVYFEYFLKSVQLFGYWWKIPDVLDEVIPHFKFLVGNERALNLRNPAGERVYGFRNSSIPYYMALQFMPEVIPDEHALLIAFDTVSEEFYMENGWDIRGRTPKECAEKYLRTNHQKPHEWKAVIYDNNNSDYYTYTNRQ